MVDIVLLAASCTLERCHPQQRNLMIMDNKPNLQRNETQWAGSRETISLLRSRQSFFLDIPFIELIDLVLPLLRTESSRLNLSFSGAD